MANTTVGTIQLLASIDTSQYKRGAQEIEKTNDGLEDNTEKTSDNMNKSFSKVAKVGIAGLIAAVVAVGAAITKNIGSAINRVDTLANSDRTFANMGFTAQATAEAMRALDQSIRGLPTPLNEAVKGVQLLSGATNDVNRAQKIFTALNNAIIGFGGSAAEVQGAIIQISQAFSNGRIDAQTWNSLIQNNLGPALNAMARQMGITTAQLKEGLSEGTISVQQFQDALIKMNAEGGGGLKSFELIAKDATSGIATGWANLNTAITRGIASIIQAIGSENISNAITAIGKAFEIALKHVAAFIIWSIEAGKTVHRTFFEVRDTLVSAFQSVRDTAVDTWQTVVSWVHTARDAIINAYQTSLQFFRDRLQDIKDFMVALGNVAQDVLTSIGNWLDRNSTAIRNWAIVIGTLLLPMFTKMTIQGVKAAYSVMVAWIKTTSTTTKGFITMALEATKSALITSAAWTKAAIVSGWQWLTVTLPMLARSFLLASQQAILSARATMIAWVTSARATATQWAISFQIYAMHLATVVAQTVLAGIRMAAAWLLAMGPIGLIVSAVIGLTALIATNFDFVQGVISGFWNWLRNSAASAWAGVRGVFSGVGSFFAGVFGSIVDIFRNVGTTVGNAIGGAFRNVINSILNGAANIINGFINAINTAIDTVNKIPGVSVGKLGTLSVPQLANGGIVTAPTLAMIGEGRESEAVIPLSKLDDMMNGGGSEYNIGTINIGSEVDGERWLRKLTGNQEITSARLVPKQNYM